MARDSRPQPQWPKPTQDYVEGLGATFLADVKAVAVRVSKHDRSAHVQKKHVDEAFEILARSGLKRRVWWKRTELEVGAGSFLIAAGLACPDILPVYLEAEWLKQTGLMTGILAFCFTGGIAAILHGWYRGLT